jgi:RNA polymerase sigma factor (sigma-70 family)
MSGSDSSLSLGAVADLALERRFVFVRRAGESDFDATVRRLQREAPDVFRALTVDRLAWAIAFNVNGAPAGSDSRAHRGKRRYLDYWTPDTPWSQVWAALRGHLPVDAGGGARTMLAELASSVACEHRDDWQNPAARPVDLEQAGLALAAVFERYRTTVAGYVARQFKQRAGNPEDIAMEAWSRVFLMYWSADARRRVLGTSAISSLVCGTAYFVGCDALRRLGVLVSRDEPDVALAGAGLRPALAGSEWTPPDQAELVAAAELARHVQTCRERLPARQRLVARMIWDHEMRQVDLARRLGVSAPAVSQLLDKARRAMHKCLKEKGLSGAA